MEQITEYIYLEEMNCQDENGELFISFSTRKNPSKYDDQTPCVTLQGQEDLVDKVLDVLFPEIKDKSNC